MQQAIDILDEMIGNRIQSTRVQEGRHEDILHNADIRYEINILNEAKSRISDL